MKKNQVFHGWMALALAVCLLTGCCVPAGAQAAGAVIAEDQAENPILLVIKHLKTVDWEKLPAEIQERIDEAGWKDMQEKISRFDWQGALKAIKSFFTESEWGEMGEEIERLFQRMIQMGAEGFASLEEYLSHFSLDDFVSTLESAANQAARQAQGLARQAESVVSDVVEAVEQAVTGLLNKLGIF